MSRVCVIGAGAAGLCAARHLIVDPSVRSVDVLEQAGQLGGTWVYTENVGYDDFGLPIHTSMYKSLRLVDLHLFILLIDEQLSLIISAKAMSMSTSMSQC